ncbi:MAG TPA: ribonuclease Z [Pyrinomonadaceae bacterium]|nr:ribonuclease Z [Pyrinomonadaceae bacterium]
MSARLFIALGTASQVPTRHRNHNGYYIRWDDEGFLLDPGEGTQRQMIYAGVSASQITKIFITHFHGDHCLGLAGVLQRLSLDRVEHKIEIHYPAYGQKYVDNLRNSSVYHNVAKIVEKPFDKEGVIFENKTLTISTRKLDHTVDSFGYRFQEKDDVTMLPDELKKLGVVGKNISKLKNAGTIEIDGKTIELSQVSVFKKGVGVAFIMDTRLCKNAFELANDADYLICESTYLSTETIDAAKNGHLTSKQAAEIASKSKVENLILTHFSQRYFSTAEFVSEAKEIFEQTIAVKDGDQVEILRRK